MCVWDHQSAADTSLALFSTMNEWQVDTFSLKQKQNQLLLVSMLFFLIINKN